MRKTRTKDAVTLFELIVVVIIIGIFASFAALRFIRTAEIARAREAILSLEQIKSAEIVYRNEEASYWPVGDNETNIDNINTKLRLYLDTRSERNWDYSVSASDAANFTALATRSSGARSGEVIQFDQDGVDKSASTWTGPWP